MGEAPDRINWELIERLSVQQHKQLNLGCNPVELICEKGHDHEPGTGEVMQEARTVQHLCDLAGVPEGTVYASHIDARVYQLVAEVTDLRDRLARIETWHVREFGPGGLVGDRCVECGTPWPCDTLTMADGTHPDLEDRDQL